MRVQIACNVGPRFPSLGDRSVARVSALPFFLVSLVTGSEAAVLCQSELSTYRALYFRERKSSEFKAKDADIAVCC